MSLEAAISYARKKRKGPIIRGELTEEIKKWITELGQEYKPAALPSDVSRGDVGECFDVAFINVFFSTKYQYVEGMAFSGTEWVYHAWLTDGIHAYDPTWAVIGGMGMEDPKNPLRYIGIPLPAGFVSFFTQKTGYSGVLGNRARYPTAVDKILEYRKKELEASK